jgi:hypothetical protein
MVVASNGSRYRLLRLLGAGIVLAAGVSAGIAQRSLGPLAAGVAICAVIVVADLLEGRLQVRSDDKGIYIQNRIHSYHVPWSDVQAINVRRRPWPRSDELIELLTHDRRINAVATREVRIPQFLRPAPTGVEVICTALREERARALGR